MPAQANLPKSVVSFSASRSSIFIDWRLPSGFRLARPVWGDKVFNTNNLRTLPLLPIKNTVLFPFIHMPFSVGRPQSLAALEQAIATEEKEVVVVSQRDSAVEIPTKADLYSVGTTAVIKRVTNSQNGRVQV